MRAFAIASLFVFFLGLMIASPGIRLLNQELGLIPTQLHIHDLELNGRPISNAAAIRFSIGIGGVFWLVALILGAKSTLNWRHNRRRTDHLE